MYQDKTLVCQDCGREFFWGVGEQGFYAQKGLIEPRFCPICRGKKRAVSDWEGRREKRIQAE